MQTSFSTGDKAGSPLVFPPEEESPEAESCEEVPPEELLGVEDISDEELSEAVSPDEHAHRNKDKINRDTVSSQIRIFILYPPEKLFGVAQSTCCTPVSTDSIRKDQSAAKTAVSTGSDAEEKVKDIEASSAVPSVMVTPSVCQETKWYPAGANAVTE